MARSNRVSRGTNRRKLVWARETGSFTLATATDTNAGILTDFQTQLGAQPYGVTIVRIRGQVLITPQTAPAAQAGFVHLGIRTYAENPDVQGAASANSEHADWMAWAYVPFDHSTQAQPGIEVAGMYRWELDVKSQRKMDELGESLLFAAANNVAGMAYTVQYGFSTLLMLS